MLKVGIVIVHYTGIEDTKKCLESILSINSLELIQKIVVVNNSTTSIDFLCSVSKKIEIINVGKNLGFTGANNIGMSAVFTANCDACWLLNNDTEVDKNALQALLSNYDESTLLGSKIYFYPGYEYHKNRYISDDLGKVIWYAGGIIDWDNIYASHKGVDEVDEGQYSQNCDTEFVTGCSMFIPSFVWNKIGGFDNNYYLYFEDVDYCIRAKRNGFKLKYCAESIVYHKNASSSGKPGSSTHVYYQTRNRIYFASKFAKLRTKIAILREMLRKLFFGNETEKEALKDIILARLGKKHD